MKINIEKNANEQVRASSGKSSVNYITEYLLHPAFWRLDDERYTWLDDEKRKYLYEGFEFDYGDILNAVRNFCDRTQTAQLLMTDQKTLNSYCLTLWNKPWDVIWYALINAARNNLNSTVFKPWAEKGNGVALKVMENVKVASMGGADDREQKIRLVNDIEDD